MPSGIKVLVVDDEDAILRGLGRVLGIRGYDVRTVSNVHDAFDLLEREPFDAVLCDFNLGEGPDGVDVLERAKATRPGALRLLMTGGDLCPRIRAAVGTTISRALRKPLDYHDLTKLLDTAVADDEAKMA